MKYKYKAFIHIQYIQYIYTVYCIYVCIVHIHSYTPCEIFCCLLFTCIWKMWSFYALRGEGLAGHFSLKLVNITSFDIQQVPKYCIVLGGALVPIHHLNGKCDLQGIRTTSRSDKLTGKNILCWSLKDMTVNALIPSSHKNLSSFFNTHIQRHKHILMYILTHCV